MAGPFPEQSNRVLRAYPREHHECFLRVSFMDDGSVPYRFDRETDSRGFVRSRVGKALKEGLEVAGKRFYFLGTLLMSEARVNHIHTIMDQPTLSRR